MVNQFVVHVVEGDRTDPNAIAMSPSRVAQFLLILPGIESSYPLQVLQTRNSKLTRLQMIRMDSLPQQVVPAERNQFDLLVIDFSVEGCLFVFTFLQSKANSLRLRVTLNDLLNQGPHQQCKQLYLVFNQRASVL